MEQHGSNEMNFLQEADQWTEALANQVHSFYFIKYRPHEDPRIMRKVAHANFEIQRKGEEIDRLNEALKTLEVKRNPIRSDQYHYSYQKAGYRVVADRKSTELARIQDFLRKDPKNNQMKPHLSEEQELLQSIKTLNHHVQYKNMRANEKKKLMKKMKEIEATREEILANVYLEAKQNQEKVEKENQRLFNKIVNAPVKVWFKSQVNSIEILRELQRGRMEKLEHCTKNLKALDNEIRLLKGRINTANSKMEKARKVLLKSEKFRLKANDFYHQKLATPNEARALVKEEDIDALEKLYKNERAKFFLQWNNNKLLKDDSERRVPESLESHGLSRDGEPKTQIRPAPSVSESITAKDYIHPRYLS